MDKFQVLADKLNIRNTPFADPTYSNWVGELQKNETIYANELVNLKNKTTNSYWYKDANNRYYSLNGFDTNDLNICWSIRTFGLFNIWNLTKGEGIKIAIIDSGIDLKNSDLIKAVPIENRFNIIDGSQNIQDNLGHGTFCSSVVASQGLISSSNNKVLGVAPESDLIIIKIADTFDDYKNIDYQNNGIQKAIELQADIISISFGNFGNNELLQQLINSAIQKGIICIASTGDDSSSTFPTVEYPANIKGIISVGSIGCSNSTTAEFGEGIFQQSGNSTGGISDIQNEGVTIVAPGDGINVYDSKGNVQIVDGTSFATPYTAGIAALWLSVVKKKSMPILNNHQSFRNFIIGNANTNFNGFEPKFSGFGLINPISILSI